MTVAVLDATESEHVFGVPLARRGLQPLFLKISNRSPDALRLQLVSVNPNYYTPLEAAGVSHYSILKRLYAFGAVAWVFLPLLILLPLKLISAQRANRRMDQCFQSLAFHLRPIPAGGTSEGFIFTPLDAGTKVVRICLHGSKGLAVDSVHAMSRQLEASIVPGDSAAGTPLPSWHPTLRFRFSCRAFPPTTCIVT